MSVMTVTVEGVKKRGTRTEWDNVEACERSARAAEKRAASGKRRRVDPTTTDRDYTPAEVEFMNAMHEYKTRYCRPFPTWSEVLEVLTGLGYTQLAEADSAVEAA